MNDIYFTWRMKLTWGVWIQTSRSYHGVMNYCRDSLTKIEEDSTTNFGGICNRNAAIVDNLIISFSLIRADFRDLSNYLVWRNDEEQSIRFMITWATTILFSIKFFGPPKHHALDMCKSKHFDVWSMNAFHIKSCDEIWQIFNLGVLAVVVQFGFRGGFL